jgi:hypothetical protein
MTTHDENPQATQEMRHNSRMIELGRQAFARSISLKLGALEAAKAAISATFGPRNNAVKRLAHQMCELGPTHPVIRLQYRNFALALAGDPELEPIGLEGAIFEFHGRWRLNKRQANNIDLSAFHRRDAAMLATRYRAMLIVLRYMRARHFTALRFEAIRQAVCVGWRR